MPPRRAQPLVLLCWCCALAFLALCLPAASPAQDRYYPVRSAEDSRGLDDYLGPRGYAVVPLQRMVGPHLEITARINGIPGHFLVDTGAQITVVHTGSLARFHLSPVKTGVRVYGAVGGPGELIQAALANRLQIGPCEASPFLLGVSDLSALNAGRPEKNSGQFDGIIGADVLQTFSFVIDCAGLELFAWKPRGADDRGTPPGGLSDFLRSRGYGEISMKRQSISDFEVSANVNGRKALWLVDTGAAITLLDSGISRRAGIKLNRTKFTVGGAGGGRQRIDVGIVDSLRFSSVAVRSAVIAVSDITSHNAALQDPGKPPIDGYLGADFLRERHAIIDCSQMRLYLAH